MCSFLYLKGKINHYDTEQKKWIALKKGDVQIIRSGSGISHSEELLEKSEITPVSLSTATTANECPCNSVKRYAIPGNTSGLE